MICRSVALKAGEERWIANAELVLHEFVMTVNTGIESCIKSINSEAGSPETILRKDRTANCEKGNSSPGRATRPKHRVEPAFSGEDDSTNSIDPRDNREAYYADAGSTAADSDPAMNLKYSLSS